MKTILAFILFVITNGIIGYFTRWLFGDSLLSVIITTAIAVELSGMVVGFIFHDSVKYRMLYYSLMVFYLVLFSIGFYQIHITLSSVGDEELTKIAAGKMINAIAQLLITILMLYILRRSWSNMS